MSSALLGNTYNNSLRRTDIDILRGIGILTVVWYHFGMQDTLNQYFASFHMILFFFVSGYCYKEGSLRTAPKQYIKKKMKAFLVPYIIWTVIFTVLNYIIDYFAQSPCGVGDYLLNIVESFMKFGAVWFLIALFITTIVGGILDYIHNRIIQILVGLLIAFTAVIANSFSIKPILRWQHAFIGVPAFIIGFQFKNIDIKKINVCPKVLYAVSFGVLGYLCSVFNGYAVFSRLEFGNSFLLFYIGALLSVIAWLFIAIIIDGDKHRILCGILSFFGRHSIYILITHQLLIKIIFSVTSRVSEGLISVMLGFVIVILIEIPICLICKTKIFRWMF